MEAIGAALWAEDLKARRARVPLIAGLAFLLLPAAGGFFMIILKDPEAARSMGLISTKAQLTMGTADWPAYLGLLAQGTAAGGAFVYSIITTWVFGREFSDRTAKELLALPTSRAAIVTAKFAVAAAWCIAATLLMLALGLLVGQLADIPGGSAELISASAVDLMGTALLTLMLMPFVALLASAGRGYLGPVGWTVLTVIFAQVAAIIGWGDWFPWAVPALFSGAAGPRAGLLGVHSYVVVIAACLAGLGMTYWWWREADQSR